jgi:hypothetical protein
MDPVLFERLLQVSQMYPAPFRFPPIGQHRNWVNFTDRSIEHHQHILNAASRFGLQTLGRNAVIQYSRTELQRLRAARQEFFTQYKAQKLAEALNGQTQFVKHHANKEQAILMGVPNNTNVNMSDPVIVKYWKNLEKVYNMRLKRAEIEVHRARHLINYWQNVKTLTPEISNEVNRILAHYRQSLSHVTKHRNNLARQLFSKKIVSGKRNITGRL